ncbi:carbohydrate ABC transporter permease [Harryflintia acetispora]|uniref:carbohydrate ABC transporter permease n=1 Tax=Harryflintia acetispora TaxID=1849041 RepID=UPI00189A1534|nr:sugar ABC transporter permease [Harryflintia acetispora]
MKAWSRFRSKLRQHDCIGLIYILPWILGFLCLQLYPLASSLWYSFTDYSALGEATFIGLENYKNIFQFDYNFGQSLKVTLLYVAVTVPMKLVFALFIAMLLSARLRAVNLFRTVYYIPSILGASVAVATLWRFMFMRDGMINGMLRSLGLDAQTDWIGDARFALLTISLLAVWQFGSSMVLFLAGIKQIPRDLYEAASIDGASKVRQFFVITIPMLTPIIFFNIIMQTITAFQDFTAPFLITSGGPANGTYLYGMYLYDNAFRYYKMGYASALSWVLFAIIIAFTLLLFRTSAKWVFYTEDK